MGESQGDPTHYRDRFQRRLLLKTLMITTALSGVLFCVINLQRGVYLLGGLELLASFFSLILLWVIGRTRRLRFWTLVYLLPFLSLMMLAMALPRTLPTVFLWAYIIPVLSHLLLGRHLGLLVASFYMLTALVIFLTKYAGNPDFINTVTMANILISGVATLAFTHAYERGSELTRVDLMRLASTDPLTGLANLYRFRETFEYEKTRAIRLGAPLSLLVLDLDWFKRINDTQGHQVGDRVLIHVAALLRRRLRATDLACRVGGEEFTVLLPDTGLREAGVVAEKLRGLIASEAYRQGDIRVPMTCSIGVAQWQGGNETLDALYRVADARLYSAKQSGRNAVVSG
ncbi:GGDEF domain-containing protein [Alloalcanivorax mobilis]|uniref:GGDEF domain-containing protein n=1 Tax=Alloalcanivorax mobilis TaxID=2019569 RepID=UPI0012FFEDBA|nr:GGDEF domain-containing protein [Alloalcanivorax mobilis]|tara:strand:- start:53843 stop:54874 length:1032 start_codon:yes stop_codon:yes gene_type:complete